MKMKSRGDNILWCYYLNVLSIVAIIFVFLKLRIGVALGKPVIPLFKTIGRGAEPKAHPHVIIQRLRF